MKCEYCPYYWQETRYDEETGEWWELEERESCHFNHDEMMGIPAPCEEEEIADRWECESSRDDWDADEDYAWQQM